jgi:Dolichyl-phosphate-mannose-protein mannosyltransferase
MWDWDEALFCLGMRSYDVTLHHPHPPGFPAYIAMGKVMRLFMPSDFRALQSVNIVAGALAFPAMFLLARELRLRFETSVIAGVLFAFFPNVWFFGGTAFSDVPSIVLVVFAVVFLLRGRDSARDYLIGTFLLAIAIGIRPQNLLVGLFPGAIATFRRRPRDIAAALLIGIVVAGGAYAGAVHATGRLQDYINTVHRHAEYIANVDSFRAPERPPLWRLFDRFFLKQYQNPALSAITSIFVAISIFGSAAAAYRREAPESRSTFGAAPQAMLWNFLIFGPFALSAWLMLDRFSINRFSIGYAPMFAIFAADGIARAARGSRNAESTIAAALIVGFIAWTAPALTPVRRDVAPSVRAVETAMRTVNPATTRLYVGYSMTPFIEYMGPAFPITRVMDDRAIPLTTRPHSVLLAEVSEPQRGGELFARDRDRLWNIARRHYFEVALRPLDDVAQFGDGWYAPEEQGMDEWRWMGARSTTTLPPPQSGDTVLRLNLSVPGELMPQQPWVTVALNGHTVEHFRATVPDLSRDYHVTPASGPNVMTLAIDHTTTDAATARQLGLRVRFISWGPG